VPPETLSAYLEQLCAAEGVRVGKGVLPLVVRAGAGSVRDSLSVLDQLMAGAGPDGVDYPLAVALLGYTDSALLDEVVGALGQADGAALFGVVDRVIQSGHDPRRFVEDLLERLRDLIVLQAMGESAAGVLRAVPPDQLARMQTQSTYLGPAELSRAADVVNTALGEMVGASSPRMHLELLCARLLLPATDAGERGLGPRVDRIERRLGAGTPAPAPAPSTTAPRPPVTPTQPDAAQPTAQPASVEPAAVDPAGADPAGANPAGVRTVGPAPARAAAEPAAAPVPAAAAPSASEPEQFPAPAAADAGPTPGTPGTPGALDTEAMRRMWPDLLRQVQGMKRSTWMIISANAQVHELAGGVLRLAFSNQGTARGFGNGQHAEVVQTAVEQLLGVTVGVEAVAGPAPTPAPPPAGGRAAPAPLAPSARPATEPWGSAGPSTPAEPPDWFSPTSPGDDPTGDDPPADDPPAEARSADDPPAAEPATPARRSGATAVRPDRAPDRAPVAPVVRGPRVSRVEQMAGAPRATYELDTPSEDDPDLEDTGPAGASVVEQLLGGQVIDVEHERG